MRGTVITASLCVCAAWAILAPQAAAQPAEGRQIVVTECLTLPPAGRMGRMTAGADAVQAMIAAGTWRTPSAGDTVTLPDGTVRTWETATPNDEGAFDVQGGYACMTFESESERVMILESGPYALVYVNGEPRMGDPYGTGWTRHAVLVRSGLNELLFAGGRGPIKAQLTAPSAPALLDTADTTVPDLIVGQEADTYVGVIVRNATTGTALGLEMAVSVAGGAYVRTALPPIPPLAARKVAVPLKAEARTEPGSVELGLRLLLGDGDETRVLDNASVRLRVRAPWESYKRTFLSDIDGSVQYYAVQPALDTASEHPALFLSTHGAGVEAIGQADAYSRKSWGHIVAPTNRRPFGFDWEDWGRLDALEVLEIARETLGTDPDRTYLTGHSMGGHGVWHLGATYPDHWGAIGPSAGWVSMWSYAGAVERGEPSPVTDILYRAMGGSDTLALAPNYAQHGVYILHGEADDNVPAEPAHVLRDPLAPFHKDCGYHAQPGAGHWWDAAEEPGADCVDWAPMFDFFARHAVPRSEMVRQVDFVTASPSISSTCHWVAVEAQEKPFAPRTVSIRWDPGQKRFVGTTENVLRLRLTPPTVGCGETVGVDMDGVRIEAETYPVGAPDVWLVKENGQWVASPPLPSTFKYPERMGPFKEAFRNRVAFVYGTAGRPEENAWSLAKARYDAEQFWYRGNGSVDVVADSAFDTDAYCDRNVVLYGNRDTNSAWAEVLYAGADLDMVRGRLVVGDRVLEGDGIGCLCVLPRPDSHTASVAIVGGTGLGGMKLTDRLPYFVSGTGYADVTVLDGQELERGPDGILGAGFFGPDWTVATGEFAWRE